MDVMEMLSLCSLIKNKKTDGPRIKVTFGNEMPVEEKPIEYDWKVMTPPPGVKYLPLTSDIFSDLLIGLVGGQ
jgi:hypothetical protein